MGPRRLLVSALTVWLVAVIGPAALACEPVVDPEAGHTMRLVFVAFLVAGATLLIGVALRKRPPPDDHDL